MKTTSTFQSPSSRRAAWWLLSEKDDLTAEEQSFVDHLFQLCPDAEKIKALLRDFKRLVKEHKVDEFDRWRKAVEESQIIEFQTFSEGLNKDREAVKAALRLSWSNGQTEGQVNRLKMIKRQMYGRANLDLLTARILYRG